MADTTKPKDKAPDADAAEALAHHEMAKAVKTIDRYALGASAAGLVPVLGINWLGVVALQVSMVSDLAMIFGRPQGLQGQRIRSYVIALIVGLLQKEAGIFAGRAALAYIPWFGPVLGVIATPAIAYGATRAVGRVFMAHFALGGTLLDFDPDSVKTEVKRQYEEGQRERGGQTAPAGATA